MSAENTPPRREFGAVSGIWPGLGLALMLAVLAHRVIAWHVPFLDGIWVACLIGLVLSNAGWTPWWAVPGLGWAARWIGAAAVVGLLVNVVLAQWVAAPQAQAETAGAVARMLATTAVLAVAAQANVRTLLARRGAVTVGVALLGLMGLAAVLPLVIEW